MAKRRRCRSGLCGTHPKRPCRLDVQWDTWGRAIKVRGPVYELYDLAVGEASPVDGRPITKYTSDWARTGHRLIAPCGTMSRARQSGHEIEGYVTVGGKRRSAFTSAGSGSSPGMIIVRRKR